MNSPDPILIVGADGMIGSALARRLVGQGDAVLRTTLSPGPDAIALDLSADVAAWTPSSKLAAA